MDKYDPELEKENYTYALAGMGISWGLAFLYLCFVCCCWSNIALGASIMECASEFVTANLRVSFLPLVAYLLCIPLFVFWVIAMVYLYTMGDVEPPGPTDYVATISVSDDDKHLLWFMLFALFWGVAFFICLQQFMLACMVCMWYYEGEGDAGRGSVSMCTAFGWGIWHHCGTVAFGAFLIALVSFIRAVFEYMVKKAESAGADANVVWKAFKCYARYYLYMLDAYVKFITKNSFIQCALRATNFCISCKNSFYLMIRHAGRFGSASIIGWIMMLLGKGVIMGASGYVTLLVVQNGYPDVQQPFVPAAIILILSYFVGSLFLSIFSFTSTALLHCFIADEDTGGGTHTPAALRKFVDFTEERNSKAKAAANQGGSAAGEAPVITDNVKASSKTEAVPNQMA